MSQTRTDANAAPDATTTDQPDDAAAVTDQIADAADTTAEPDSAEYDATLFTPDAVADLKIRRHHVVETKAEYDELNEQTKSAKKTYEAARDAFERAFDRVVQERTAPGLPFDGAHQADVVGEANDNAEYVRIAKGLQAAGYDHTPVDVAAMNDTDRAEVIEYLEALEAADDDDAEGPHVPDILREAPGAAEEAADEADADEPPTTH